jgi:hypothetical protein
MQAQRSPEPLVWPVVTKLEPGIRAFAGHTDTVPDIVGRIGTPASLVIFTEGNHLMVLLSDDIIGAFPSWAESQPQYADLNLDNIVVVTVPQPVVVQMLRTGAIALGNLVLDVSRKSGFYPDIIMAGLPLCEKCASSTQSSRRCASSQEIAALQCLFTKEIHSEFIASLMSRAAGRELRCRRRLANRELVPDTVLPSTI